jgi:hypothetical protein
MPGLSGVYNSGGPLSNQGNIIVPDEVWIETLPDGRIMEYLYRQNDVWCVAHRREKGRESVEMLGGIEKGLTHEQVEKLFHGS